MEIFFFWLLFSGVAWAIASNKGRCGFCVFLLSLLLTPLVGIIVALAMASHTEQQQRQAVDTGQSTEYRKCPYCAEAIRREATKCKHCGSDIEPVIQKTCPSCNSRLSLGQAVCGSCGTIIKS